MIYYKGENYEFVGARKESYRSFSRKPIIENGTLTEFLDIALRNIGRNETNSFNAAINKLRGTYRFLTNFNLSSAK